MRRPCLLYAALLLSLPGFASAQQTAAPAPLFSARSAPAPGASERWIYLDVVVTDKRGKSIPSLVRDDFTLLDNNQPSNILSFQAFGASAETPASPVQILLLIDTVNLDIDTVSYARQQVDQFLRRNGGHLNQPVSIFWLTNDGVKAQPEPSTDGNALAAAVDSSETHLRTINSSAGYYGVIERMQFSLQSIAVIAQKEAAAQGRKLLIWIGSGWPPIDSPNLSLSSKELRQLFAEIVQLSAGLRQARIALYSVQTGVPNMDTFLYKGFLKGVKRANDANLPNLDLRVLATQSGGRVLGPNNDLAGEIENCLEDAGIFYTLSFDPPRADRPDEYHDLKVRIDKPGLTARTSTGYYDQP